MSAEGESQPASSIPGRNSTECKPLFDAATRDLFQSNAFRITGLSVDATAPEIARHEAKLKRLEGLVGLGIADEAERLKVMEQFGLKGSGYTSAFPLKVPPTVDQIREAFQKLNKSPDRRIIDEFFWFWPAEFGEAASDPAIQSLAAGKGQTVEQIWTAAENSKTESVVAKHNLAVLWHLRALDLENDGIGREVDAKKRVELEETWRNALQRWQALSTDDALWEKVAWRIRQIRDARLTTGFGRRMRFTLRPALNKINAELALAYAKAGNMELATAHVQFMRETGQGSDEVAKAGELVLAPMISRVREQIKRAGEQAQTNPETADQAANDLIAGMLPLTGLFDLFFGEAEHPAYDLLEEVASTSVSCLVGYLNKTGGNNRFIELHELALKLAKTDELRDLIQHNIGVGKRNLLCGVLQTIRESTAGPAERLQRFQHEVIQFLLTVTASLDSKPEIRNEVMDSAATFLNDIALDAWNKSRDQKTAIAAIELAIQYACNPELKKNIEIGRSRPLHELLKSILESTAAPKARLQRFQREAIQPLLTAAARLDSYPEIKNALMDDAAIVLNRIAAEAWNKFRDKKTALDAIQLAIAYACAPELKKQANDNAQIFLTKKPPSQAQKSSKPLPAGCWIWIALFVIFILARSCHQRRESSNNGPYRPSNSATVSMHLAPSNPLKKSDPVPNSLGEGIT